DGKYIYTGIGENILYQFLYEYYYEDGTVDDSNWYTSDEIVESMFEGWRTSPGHNENMLTEHYESAGIGIAINEHAEIVATHNFC
ncbi:MAG: CAP domain-containing protein, partial [Thermoproteota archaeon]